MMNTKAATASLTAVLVAVSLFSQPSAAASQTFYLGAGSAPIDIAISGSGIPLERLYFEPGEHSPITVRVFSLDSNSTRVYGQFLVNVTGLDSPPEGAILDIAISKAWIRDNRVDSGTLSFYYMDSDWKPLQMVPLDKNGEFMRFRARSPVLSAYFIVTGEPVPFDFAVTSQCNGNTLCEPELGEDAESCRDCAVRNFTRCVPSQRFCLNEDYLFVCDAAGAEYWYEECALGCSEDECLTGVLGGPAGMSVAFGGVLVSAVGFLLAVVFYMGLSIRRMRKELRRAEDRRASHEDLKMLARG